MTSTFIGDGIERVVRLGMRVLSPGPAPTPPAPTRRPVVLVGGMATTAAGLEQLRAGLALAGHPVTTMTTDAGLGCAGRAVEELADHVRATAAGADAPVALVGHSRGGQFARVVARRRPDDVAAVVTLGTPRTTLGVNPAALLLGGTLTAMGSLGVPGLATAECVTGSCCRSFRADLAAPTPHEVPLTTVRARHDVVVPSRGAVDPDAHDVEVAGGHLGLLTSPYARDAVLSALAAAEPGASAA